jgi:hypothetical protein
MYRRWLVEGNRARDDSIEIPETATNTETATVAEPERENIVVDEDNHTIVGEEDAETPLLNINSAEDNDSVDEAEAPTSSSGWVKVEEEGPLLAEKNHPINISKSSTTDKNYTPSEKEPLPWTQQCTPITTSSETSINTSTNASSNNNNINISKEAAVVDSDTSS